MYAAVVEHYGTPVHREFDEPIAGSEQVVVEVGAAGVNPVDLAKAAGTFYSGRASLPFVAGGEGVGKLADGRRVYFNEPILPFGTMAQRALVDPVGTYDVPDALTDDAVAVALGIAGFAAWLPLTYRAKLQPGETVLVLGATGVLGSIAVQGAKLLGAGRVVAAGRGEEALARAAELGADTTVRLDGAGGEGLTAAFREAAGGDVDVIIDPLWGEPAAAAIAALALHGRLVQVGQSAGPTATLPSSRIRGRVASIIGHTNFETPHEVKQEAFRTMAGHAAAGRLRVDVERMPLSDVAEAWERQKAGTGGRKLVLIP
jgi:NADPH2:quinone reductase